MEKIVVSTLAKCLQANEPVALVSVIENRGSSPGKTGAMMLVRQSGKNCGTVGGGSLEKKATDEALSCIAAGSSKEVTYNLSSGSELAMLCGGTVRLFIKVFSHQPELVIVGCGHIGAELYTLGVHQGFRVVIFDDRAELVTEDRFPEASLKIVDDLPGALQSSSIGPGSYVAIATPSHETDRLCLEALVEADAAYLGMIGSSRKIEATFTFLLEKGVSKHSIEKVFAPMGLNIASIAPKEIAMSIMSEILLVKNGGSAEHMRHVKNIELP